VGALAWRFLVVAAAAWIVLLLFTRLRVVVLPAIVALLISTLLVPIKEWLQRRGTPSLLATWATVLGSLLLLVGLVALIAPQVADELDNLGTSIRQGTEEVLSWLADGPLNLSRGEVNTYIDRAAEQLRANSSAITSGVLAGAVVAIEVVAGMFLTLVLVFFIIKDGDDMWEWVTNQFSASNRRHVVAVGERTWQTLSGYVRGTALVALADAVLIGIALFVIGVPLIVPLMVLTFFGGFFPLVGATLAGAVAALVALVTTGPLDALLVVGAVTAIQQVEGDLLQPMVLGRAVRLHPVVILLSLTAGAVLAGIAGAFLAVPVAAVAASIGNYVKLEMSSQDRLPEVAASATARSAK